MYHIQQNDPAFVNRGVSGPSATYKACGTKTTLKGALYLVATAQ